MIQLCNHKLSMPKVELSPTIEGQDHTIIDQLADQLHVIQLNHQVSFDCQPRQGLHTDEVIKHSRIQHN